MQTCIENKLSHQLEAFVLNYHQILRTGIIRKILQWVEKINAYLEFLQQVSKQNFM